MIDRRNWVDNMEHYCPDWDGLLINKKSPEFSACTCDKAPFGIPTREEAVAIGIAKLTSQIETDTAPKLYACVVQSVVDNDDGTHRITVERPLVGNKIPVPFEFNYPSELMSNRIARGRTINVDLDMLARKVKRGWCWDGNVQHYAVGEETFCGESIPLMAPGFRYRNIPTAAPGCGACIESELFKFVKVGSKP